MPERICVQCDAAWTRPTRIVTVHTGEGRRDIRQVGDLTRCDCFAPTRAGVVLDPFFGTGTTAVVAERLGRDWVGIELNPVYRAIARERHRGSKAGGVNGGEWLPGGRKGSPFLSAASTTQPEEVFA